MSAGRVRIPAQVRLARARKAGTYEFARSVLTEMLTIRHLKHHEAAAELGWSVQTLRTAAWTLRITNKQIGQNRDIVPAIRAYTASWDRGW